ncbi:MAG: hypothetical protein RRY80_05355 [Lachnospiraceae bacterium]
MKEKRKIREKEKQSVFKNRKMWMIVIGIILSIILLFIVIGKIQEFKSTSYKEETNILKQIKSYPQTTWMIEQEEFDFFKQLAQKEVKDPKNKEEIAAKAKELLTLSSAQFFLGNKLGLSEPYSFTHLKDVMEQENAQRKVDKQQGKEVYGPVEYTLSTYYQYVSSRLRAKVIDNIVFHADELLVSQSKDYYKEHKEDYRIPKNICYSITIEGNTTEKTISWSEIQELEHSDSILFDFLIQAEEGIDTSYETEEGEATLKILTVTWEKTDFESNKSTILTDYLNQVYYDQLLAQIAEKNSVQITND